MITDTRHNELIDLAFAVCDGTATDDQIRSIEEIVSADPSARLLYLQCLELHFEMDRRASAVPLEAGVGLGIRDLGLGIHLPVGAAVELPHQPAPQPPATSHESRASTPEPPFPPIILDPSTTHYPLSAIHSSLGSWAFSYMVATVVVGAMILGAWALKVTHHYELADNSRGQTAPGESAQKRPEMVFVGRITGMVECKWSDPSTEPFAGAYIPLGRKYALASGLMQITYDSGAKVILEGPCTYEVESSAGGYLALGKLTAKVEQRGEGRGARGEGAVNPKSQIPNQQISNPQSLIPNPFFSVRTPTAVVTDLGTEFGVEVSVEGSTTSHVFSGSVKVQTIGDARQRNVVLHENESAQVKNDDAGGPRLVSGGKVGDLPNFVRRIVQPLADLDLLDIVAGGDGTGNRRDRGIDPTDGSEVPTYISRTRDGDRNYHPVGWHKLIDGVFVPDGRAGAVQLDSAGHKFGEFPPTVGTTWGAVWARSAEIKVSEIHSAKPDGCWLYSAGRGDQYMYMPSRRGLLGLHPNAGITFDLEAIRRAQPGASPNAFRAAAGMFDASIEASWANAQADLWIFVDGRLKWKRIGLRPQDCRIDLDIPLDPEDRFLTLVSTDGGDGNGRDWVVFGDPLLKMTSTEQEELKGGPAELQ